MPTDLEKWRTKQIAAAIERGVNAIDAVKALDDFLASVPPGADPATYVRPAYQLEQNVASDEVLADARGAWFGDVDGRVARLLDAKQSE